MSTRTIDGIDLDKILKAAEESFEARRLRRWLRASVVFNLLLLVALIGALRGLSSISKGAAAPSTAPHFSR